MCWDLYRHGTELEGRIVDWALENLVPLALLRDRPEWLFVSYEDLIVHTPAVIDYLAAELQLEDRQAMARQVARPSRSVKGASSLERQQLINERNQDRLVDWWRAKISADELAGLFSNTRPVWHRLVSSGRQSAGPPTRWPRGIRVSVSSHMLGTYRRTGACGMTVDNPKSTRKTIPRVAVIGCGAAAREFCLPVLAKYPDFRRSIVARRQNGVTGRIGGERIWDPKPLHGLPVFAI